MPYTDILNPTPTHPLNPDYGFQKKRPVTHLVAKANQGAPYFREIMDVGHQFSFNWADKLRGHAQKLKWYYESYRDGLFTYIDHEAGGRHYVGRFSSPIEPIPTSHNHWTIQGAIFDEVPLSSMISYPSDWQNDAIWRQVTNDFGDRMVAAVSGTWALATVSGAKSGQVWQNGGTVTTDQAGYVYTGYGFKLWAVTGPAYGKATVLLDGVSVGTPDLYSSSLLPSSCVLTVQNVPLGLHTITIQATNTKNASSSGYTIHFDALQVMR
jgi:hypothetical protein